MSISLLKSMNSPISRAGTHVNGTDFMNYTVCAIIQQLKPVKATSKSKANCTFQVLRSFVSFLVSSDFNDVRLKGM